MLAAGRLSGDLSESDHYAFPRWTDIAEGL